MNKPTQPKSTSSPRPSRWGKASRRTVAVLLAVGLVAAFFIWRSASRRTEIDVASMSRTQVRRGDMTISLLQTGELQSKRSEEIANETGERATILYVVDDGARVERGDLLIELDTKEVEEEIMEDETSVTDAETALETARKSAEIAALQHETDLKSAKLAVELAELDLQKYIEAEYAQDVRTMENDITVAQEELSRAKRDLEWTQRLVEKGYANQQELEADQFEVQRLELGVESKQESLRILRNYTHEKELKSLQNAVSEATTAVETLVKTYESELAQQKADLDAKEKALELARTRLTETREQLGKSKMFSEWNGFVFYPQRSWRDQGGDIEEGSEVYPRQSLLEYPDLNSWRIIAGAPESIIDRIKPGQKAYATVDAFPDVLLEALVDRISIVPDSGRWFENSNAKTYPVYLDVPTTPTAELKPGMSVKVEIVTGRLEDVLMVPLQAVTAEGDTHYVYTVEGDRVVRTEVAIGESNDTDVEILSGVKEGDELLLYAPINPETRAALTERPLSRVEREQAQSVADEREAERRKAERPAVKAEERSGAAEGETGGGEQDTGGARNRNGGGQGGEGAAR